MSEFFHVDFVELKTVGGKITAASLYNRAGILLLQERFEWWISEEDIGLDEISFGMLQYYHDAVI
ncbi:MAG: hypothetical protein AB1763_05880 [Campylobacterota bacterium]